MCVCVCVSVRAQSCSTLCSPMDCSPPGCPVHGISSAKNTGAGCHMLLHEIFPIQGSNSSLLNWQMDSLSLCHLESPQCQFMINEIYKIGKWINDYNPLLTLYIMRFEIIFTRVGMSWLGWNGGLWSCVFLYISTLSYSLFPQGHTVTTRGSGITSAGRAHVAEMK